MEGIVEITGYRPRRVCEADASRAPALRAIPTPLRTFYRWGWVPLVAGCAVIAAVELTLWEIMLRRFGVSLPNTAERWLYVARAITTSGVLASFVGWFVIRSRDRLEAAREDLRREEARLAMDGRRLEQAAGRAAMLRLLAHELRNPLNGLLLHCRALRHTLSTLPPEARARGWPSIEVVEAEARRVSALVDDYVSHGGATHFSADDEPVGFRSVVGSVVNDLQSELRDKSVLVDLDVPRGLPDVRGDRVLLEAALHHVVRNGVEAVARGGRITISASATTSEVIVDVADNGRGFSDLAAALRPFYSTKDEGSGLGLTIVRDVVRAHRGSLALDNEGIDGGGHVRIRLPRATE